jgi:hypothetical protein
VAVYGFGEPVDPAGGVVGEVAAVVVVLAAPVGCAAPLEPAAAADDAAFFGAVADADADAEAVASADADADAEPLDRMLAPAGTEADPLEVVRCCRLSAFTDESELGRSTT